MIEQLAASETVRYVAGIIGGVLSLQYGDKDITWYERAIMVATGASVAAFCAPAIQAYFTLGDAYTSGISFVLGLYGWSITGGIIKIIKTKELRDALINRVIK